MNPVWVIVFATPLIGTRLPLMVGGGVTMERPGGLFGGSEVSRNMTLNIPKNDHPRREHSVLTQVTTGSLKFSDDVTYSFTASDLIDQGSIGSGNYGTVYKMFHRESGKHIAVKKIVCRNIDDKDQLQILKEHDTFVNCNNPNIVQFYGAIFHDNDCWICMELMDVSLDLLYKRVYATGKRLDENVIGHITVSLVDALNYLKETLNIIHRDVKPSNVLVDRNGIVKLCDFGICGKLENSVAKTHDAGCRPYLAPERVQNTGAYDVRADVWALGITLYEIATGKFPYNFTSVFDQIVAVCSGDPPNLLMTDIFSIKLVSFVNTCLVKDKEVRPKYRQLKKMDFYIYYSTHVELRHTAMIDLGEKALDTLLHPVVQVA